MITIIYTNLNIIIKRITLLYFIYLFIHLIYFNHSITWVHSESASIASRPLFHTVHLLFSINPPQHQKSIEINYNYIYQSFLHHFHKYTHCSRVYYSRYNVALSSDPSVDNHHLYIFLFITLTTSIALIFRRSIAFYRSIILLFESFFLFILRSLLQLL